MKFRNLVNSRKFSWTIVGLGAIVSLAVFWFLPLKIPMHFNGSGAADDYSNRIQIFLFPFIQLIIMFLTGFAGGPPFTWPARKKNTAQEPIELENIELPVSAW